MAKEEPKWAPSRWKLAKINTFIRHTYKQAMWACCDILGEYEGNKVAAQIRVDELERRSVAQLREMGVKLIGDVANG